MPKNSNSTIIAALLTAAALLAFAAFRRHHPPLNLPETAFYLAAAFVCLFPSLSRALRCQMRRRLKP